MNHLSESGMCGTTSPLRISCLSSGYFIFSILGNYNYFFFAAHLLDAAVAIPSLKTILQSVTHNGKQLANDCHALDYYRVHLHRHRLQLLP